MPAKLLATYPYLNLLHPGPVPVLETEWLGFAGSLGFWAALLEAPRLARPHQAGGWVTDDRRLGAGHPTDLAWAHENLLRLLSEVGVRRFAHLEAGEARNQLPTNGMGQRGLPGRAYEFRHFTEPGAARAWAAGQ